MLIAFAPLQPVLAFVCLARRVALPLFCWLVAQAAWADTHLCISLPRFEDRFQTQLQTELADQAQQQGHISLRFEDAREKTDRQTQQLTDFIHQGCQAVLLVPVTAEASLIQSWLSTADAAGIPLIFLNRRPPLPPSPTLHYVGPDDYQIGQLQMEYLAKLHRYQGAVAILVGEPDTSPAKLRTQAVKDVIAKYPKMHLVAVQVGHFNRAEGEKIMNHWLQNHTEFDMLVANNDEMALGAVMALKKAGQPKDKISIAGVEPPWTRSRPFISMS